MNTFLHIVDRVTQNSPFQVVHKGAVPKVIVDDLRIPFFNYVTEKEVVPYRNGSGATIQRRASFINSSSRANSICE